MSSQLRQFSTSKSIGLIFPVATQQGVCSALSFQTASYRVKVWIAMIFRISCCFFVRFLTIYTCPKLCNLASESIIFCLPFGFQLSLFSC